MLWNNCDLIGNKGSNVIQFIQFFPDNEPPFGNWALWENVKIDSRRSGWSTPNMALTSNFGHGVTPGLCNFNTEKPNWKVHN